MGIRGLTSFVDKHYVWHSVPISSIERLVIDGNNLCYNLYYRNGVEWSLGGNYPGFFKVVKTFFEKLQGLHIGFYVILDGIDYKEEKTATVLQRKLQSYERIRKNQRPAERNMDAANGRSASEDGVLPLLGRMVFTDALRDAGVPFLIADGEADAEIVAVANFHQCPVLADDSDFYMFNIKEGYFPLRHFFRALEGTADCVKKYHVTSFADQFLHQNINLRLLIPAILGNDFLKRVVYPGLDNPETIIHCISRHSTSEDFLDKMPDTVDQESLHGNFSKAAALYNAELRKDPKELSEVTNLHLPEWLLSQYREGHFAQQMVSAIMTHKSILPAVVDDIMSQSSLSVSEKIRQCIYGILIQDVQSVQETVRNKATTCLHDKPTELLLLKTKSEPLTLNKICDLKSSRKPSLQLTKNLCHVLYCQKSVHHIRELSEEWRLVSASLIYWYRNAEPTPSYYLVEALVQCFIICHSDSSDLVPLSQADWKFSHQDFLEALHAFAQWQCTYNDAVALNQLLQEPFKYISPACLYSGKVAMHCASLCSQSQMHSFTPEQHEQYDSLMNLIPTKPKDDTQAGLVDKESYATENPRATQTVTFTHPNPFELLQEQSPSENKKK